MQTDSAIIALLAKMGPKSHSATPPTARQLEVYKFIRSIIQSTGRPPTVKEIRDYFSLKSNNGVRNHLQALQDKGLIKISPGTHRNITLLEPIDTPKPTVRSIPIAGTIPASEARKSTIVEPEFISVDSRFFPHDELYALRATKELSPTIVAGDIVLIHPKPTAKKGELILLHLNGEMMIRRYITKGLTKLLMIDGDQDSAVEVRLSPWPSAHHALVGEVVGVIRAYQPKLSAKPPNK